MTLQFLVSGWMVDLLLRWGQKMSRAKSRVVLNAFSEMPTGHPRPAVDQEAGHRSQKLRVEAGAGSSMGVNVQTVWTAVRLNEVTKEMNTEKEQKGTKGRILLTL